MIVMANSQSPSSLATDASSTPILTTDTESSQSESSDVSCLQEKCSHLSWIIRQLSKNLKSNKIRNDSIELLSKTLNNIREENVTLREKVHRYQKILLGLIYKIQQGQHLQMEQNEKEMLLSLVGIQNTDVIEQLKNAGQIEVQQLRTELSETRDKLIKAEHIISEAQSNHNIGSAVETEMNSSNPEIQLLQGRIQEMAQQYSIQEHLFHSLKEEANDIRAKLKEKIVECRLYHNKLDEELHLQIENPKVGFPQDCSESLINNLKQEMDVLKEDLRKMKNNYEEVLAMNSRWQKYNRDRDEYVRNLLLTIQNLQDSITYSPNQDHSKKLEHLYKAECREKIEIQKEYLELKQKYQESENQFQAARLQLMSYETNENCYQNCVGSTTVSQKEDLERIQMLEHQVKAFTEDWQAERADRENALAKICDLEAENRVLQEQLREFNRNDRRHYRSTFSCNLPGQWNDRLISRGCNRSPAHNYFYNNVEVDAATPTPIAGHNVSKVDSQDSSNKEKGVILPCPQCNKEFRQTDLIDHFEICERTKI